MNKVKIPTMSPIDVVQSIKVDTLVSEGGIYVL